MTKIPRTELLKQKQQASKNCLPLVQTYHPTIFPTNKAVMKDGSTTATCRSPNTCSAAQLSAHITNAQRQTNARQEKNLHYTNLYRQRKCMKSKCRICNIIDTRPSLKIPGTDITVRPGKYYCNSSNVIYLNKCKKCDSRNYIGEASTFFRLRMNNHKKASVTTTEDYQ